MLNNTNYIIHQTDLFRPHEDPDDHWDLALQFALQHYGLTNISAILLDSPLLCGGCHKLPDTVALEMLNGYYKAKVPFGINKSFLLRHKESFSGTETNVNLLLRALEKCDGKVSIHICGSCTDIAKAGRREPQLFEQKCAGIYLNAGASFEKNKAEYNVALNPDAFASVFSLPCNIYWMPCFEYCDDFFKGESGVYSTFYQFEQAEILPFLPLELQKYFVFMYEKEKAENLTEYMNTLTLQRLDELLTKYCNHIRNMWCTAGFFHSAGLAVLNEGTVISATNTNDSVFDFVPINIHSINNGIVDWEFSSKKERCFIFQKKNETLYPFSMITAMKHTFLGNIEQVVRACGKND